MHREFVIDISSMDSSIPNSLKSTYCLFVVLLEYLFWHFRTRRPVDIEPSRFSSEEFVMLAMSLGPESPLEIQLNGTNFTDGVWVPVALAMGSVVI
jgi:hypothetical protein